MMSSLNLIMSGAYVGQELVAEFGMLPPSFLPVGVGRLYDLQIDVFRKSLGYEDIIHLILPESFEVSIHDRMALEGKKVFILSVPDRMTLGEAVIYALNMLANGPVSVRVLYGDTVLDELPGHLDCVVAHEDSDDYAWAAVNHEQGFVVDFVQIQASSGEDVVSPVACGFFSFSSSITLIRSIISAKYDFLEALNVYNRSHKMRVQTVDFWYDFGHLQNYFHSRRLVTTARSFNAMKITKYTVEKSSVDAFKMESEAHWLTHLPPSLQPYAVSVFENGISRDGKERFYTTDYQYAPNLAELFVFSKVGRLTWKKILASCSDFLETCSAYCGDRPRDDYFSSLIQEKTNTRLETYANKASFDLDRPVKLNGVGYPSLRKIADRMQACIERKREVSSTIMHGDFCFSNILYNSRNQRISVIDPRGYVFPNEVEIYGDLRYDLAKLSHSINGFYDLIVAGRYILEAKGDYDMSISFEYSPMRDWLRSSFSSMHIAGIHASDPEIRAMTVLLFLSMLPLHADRPDRQRAFIANAVRLYSDFVGE